MSVCLFVWLVVRMLACLSIYRCDAGARTSEARKGSEANLTDVPLSHPFINVDDLMARGQKYFTMLAAPLSQPESASAITIITVLGSIAVIARQVPDPYIRHIACRMLSNCLLCVCIIPVCLSVCVSMAMCLWPCVCGHVSVAMCLWPLLFPYLMLCAV